MATAGDVLRDQHLANDRVDIEKLLAPREIEAVIPLTVRHSKASNVLYVVFELASMATGQSFDVRLESASLAVTPDSAIVVGPKPAVGRRKVVARHDRAALPPAQRNGTQASFKLGKYDFVLADRDLERYEALAASR